MSKKKISKKKASKKNRKVVSREKSTTECIENRNISKVVSSNATKCKKGETSPKGNVIDGWIAYGVTLLLKVLVINRVFPLFSESIFCICALKCLECVLLDEFKDEEDVLWKGKYIIFGLIEIVTNVIFDISENSLLIALFFIFAFIGKKIILEDYSETLKKYLYVISLLPLTSIFVILINIR
ncbi:hypothetical protein [Candidatus Clostridium helianthi]|uniref:Uncharacterized protein n=1 Tax=Candidatus Clostridium helianthi TaxID=3381660 RepID=A0ABW8RZE8_9CLOT